MKICIATDVTGQPHVYDLATGKELDCVGFVVDYNRDAGKIFVSLTFDLAAGDLALNLTGEAL